MNSIKISMLKDGRLKFEIDGVDLIDRGFVVESPKVAGFDFSLA